METVRNALAKVRAEILDGETPNKEAEVWKALNRTLHTDARMIYARVMNVAVAVQKATGYPHATAYALGPEHIVSRAANDLLAKDISDEATAGMMYTPGEGPGSLISLLREACGTTFPRKYGSAL